MKAEIIAVGSELLSASRLDTNSLWLTGQLNAIGIEVRFKCVVGDDRRDLARAFGHAWTNADVVIATGGLGPTEDDLTREVVAGELGLPLELNANILAGIRARFDRRGLRMPEINERQAMVPRGGEPLDNPNGTAPGLWIERDGRITVLLPGPPRELQPMFERHVRPRLEQRTGGARLLRRVLKTTGRTESHVEELAKPIYLRYDNPATTILAAPGQVELHLVARGADEAAARARLDLLTAELTAALGDIVFSTNDEDLEVVVGRLLRERGLTVAVAESCTGGLVTSRLTDVSGSSAYVERGVVCYSNRAKTELLGVSPELIAAHGAVSQPVAEAMAVSVRARAGTHLGLAVTGIAGPDGGTPEKPVGTVHYAVSHEGGVEHRMFCFPGGRAQIKFQASQAVLDLVRRLLMRQKD